MNQILKKGCVFHLSIKKSDRVMLTDTVTNLDFFIEGAKFSGLLCQSALRKFWRLAANFFNFTLFRAIITLFFSEFSPKCF